MMKQTLMAAAAAATLASPVSALTYTLGENDAGAANGVALNATTNGPSSPSLTLNGTGGTYSSSVPAGGSSISAAFSGTQFYTESGQSFYSGIDLANFSLSFDVMATSVTSFHVPVSLGRYGSGSAFIYTTGSDWRFHINGAGDQINGANSLQLNTWQHIELTRTGGTTSLFVNGSLVGSSPNFPAAVSDDFSIASAKNGSGGPDGRFIGNIDNVVMSTIPEPSAAALVAGLGLLVGARRRRLGAQR